MNNKRLGSAFESEFCALLKARGYWVHFLAPDARGAQPFDIIACRDNIPFAFDCKTLSERKHFFSIDRLETNQILAFERWLKCGNNWCSVVVKWRNNIYEIPYFRLKEYKKIDMEKMLIWR